MSLRYPRDKDCHIFAAMQHRLLDSRVATSDASYEIGNRNVGKQPQNPWTSVRPLSVIGPYV